MEERDGRRGEARFRKRHRGWWRLRDRREGKGKETKTAEIQHVSTRRRRRGGRRGEHHGRRRKTSDRAEYATQSKRVLLLQKTFHRSAPFLRLHVSILRGGKLFSTTFYVRHERKILHSHRSES